MIERWSVLLAAGLCLACPIDSGPGVEAPPSPPSADVSPAPRAEEPTPPAAPRDPPRLLTDPGSGVRIVWSGAAASTAVAGPDLIVLEPDGRHINAVDWRDGEARWRIQVPTSGSARLYGLGDRVLLHDRDRATVIEADRGRVLGRHPAPLDDRWPHNHGVVRRKDACAWVSPCGIRAFDCETGAPHGRYFASIERADSDEGGEAGQAETSCSPTPQLLGRHEDVTVFIAALPRTDETGRPAGSAPSLVGLADDSEEPLWSVPLRSARIVAGLTDDGGCFSLDEDAPALRMYECATGEVRWDRPLGPGRLELHPIEDEVVVARYQGRRWRLHAYATADGQSAWSTRLSKRQYPVLPGSPIPDAHTTGRRRVYALIDPQRGRVAGELVAGRDEELWRDPNGGFVLAGRELRELGANGRIVRQQPFTGTGVQSVLAGHLVTLEGEAIEIYDREQLRERARVEGRMSLEASAALPDDRRLLRRQGDDGVALVLGFETPGRR
ncbi:MAG: PQQ-binding-like beta-propeller repeat protein [Myxococcota bacterium]